MTVSDIISSVGNRGVAMDTAKADVRTVLACKGYARNLSSNKYYKRDGGPSAGTKIDLLMDIKSECHQRSSFRTSALASSKCKRS
jgi:hypothetical protein